MSCKDCDKFEEEGKIAYYRWGVANVGMIGCEKHLLEIFDALNDIQEEKEKMAKDKKAKKLKHGRVTVFGLNDKITIIGLRCQTDFLARSEMFGNKAYEICRYVQNKNWNVVATMLKEIEAESKEEIELNDYHTVELDVEEFTTQYYIHHDNAKIGIVTLKFKKWSQEAEELAKDIAMHIVAFDPIYMREDEINWDEVDLTFTEDQMKGKPEKVIEMMKKGKKKKYMKEHLLLEQPFVKDLKISVQDAINKVDSSIELISAYGIFV